MESGDRRRARQVEVTKGQATSDRYRSGQVSSGQVRCSQTQALRGQKTTGASHMRSLKVTCHYWSQPRSRGHRPCRGDRCRRSAATARGGAGRGGGGEGSGGASLQRPQWPVELGGGGGRQDHVTVTSGTDSIEERTPRDSIHGSSWTERLDRVMMLLRKVGTFAET